MNIVSFGLMVGSFCTALFCIALFCIALFCIALFCTALFCTALSRTALSRIAWAYSGLFGTANSFGSLAGSTVTNIGPSVVDGNLDV
jgi:hypothetical protein